MTSNAGGPVNNVCAVSGDSSALSIISFTSSNPSIVEKTLRARSLTYNGSGTSYIVLSLLRKSNITRSDNSQSLFK
jgi:hypothetical protein